MAARYLRLPTAHRALANLLGLVLVVNHRGVRDVLIPSNDAAAAAATATSLVGSVAGRQLNWRQLHALC